MRRRAEHAFNPVGHPDTILLLDALDLTSMVANGQDPITGNSIPDANDTLVQHWRNWKNGAWSTPVTQADAGYLSQGWTVGRYYQTAFPDGGKCLATGVLGDGFSLYENTAQTVIDPSQPFTVALYFALSDSNAISTATLMEAFLPGRGRFKLTLTKSTTNLSVLAGDINPPHAGAGAECPFDTLAHRIIITYNGGNHADASSYTYLIDGLPPPITYGGTIFIARPTSQAVRIGAAQGNGDGSRAYFRRILWMQGNHSSEHAAIDAWLIASP